MFFLFDLRQIDHIFRQNLTDILGTFLRCIRNQLCINGNALNLSVHSALLFPLLTLFSSHFNTFSVTFIADFGRLIHPAPTFLHATKCRSLRDEYKRDNEYDHIDHICPRSLQIRSITYGKVRLRSARLHFSHQNCTDKHPLHFLHQFHRK